MSTSALDYRISEFETQQAATEYDIWFQKQVEEGLKCEVLHTHDEVLERLQQHRSKLMKTGTPEKSS